MGRASREKRERIHARVQRTVSVFDMWRTYRDEVVPPDASAVQVEETRRAFYAGVAGMLDLMMKVSGDDVSEDEGAEYLATLQRELKAFEIREPS